MLAHRANSNGLSPTTGSAVECRRVPVFDLIQRISRLFFLRGTAAGDNLSNATVVNPAARFGHLHPENAHHRVDQSP